ncbi:hypothetical protein ABH09_04760 [Treponema sp. OMZ 803]|jgi:hypothetical protein|uniref:hypothetical protein n=1 Tax=Treponema sp. OMZ 803 TaxID=120682 RepID=UPI0020A5FB3B|nr:hypothetical protein [Treponema sp. OMZ 803]UTC53962.1 hypothetical protein ABH09_04760 [Treponema sp. OMZ 803]
MKQMYEIAPIIKDGKVFIGVGNQELTFTSGCTSCNPQGKTELTVWMNTAKLVCLEELVMVCSLLTQQREEEASELAASIMRYLNRTRKEYPRCMYEFKERLDGIKG